VPRTSDVFGRYTPRSHGGCRQCHIVHSSEQWQIEHYEPFSIDVDIESERYHEATIVGKGEEGGGEEGFGGGKEVEEADCDAE